MRHPPNAANPQTRTRDYVETVPYYLAYSCGLNVMSLTNLFHGIFSPQEWDSQELSQMEDDGLYRAHASPFLDPLEPNASPDAILSENPHDNPPSPVWYMIR